MTSPMSVPPERAPSGEEPLLYTANVTRDDSLVLHVEGDRVWSVDLDAFPYAARIALAIQLRGLIEPVTKAFLVFGVVSVCCAVAAIVAGATMSRRKEEALH